jgi:hypothetical protein
MDFLWPEEIGMNAKIIPFKPKGHLQRRATLLDKTLSYTM